MKENEFIDFLKGCKKSENTIRSYINHVKTFEIFMLRHKQLVDIEQAAPQDLVDYVAWGKQEGKNMYGCLWGVKAYYQSRQNTEMWFSTIEQMENIQNETRKLGEFPGVDRVAVKALKSIGITTVNQLLHAVHAQTDQAAIAGKCGVSEQSIAELVKMANLSRLPGLKKIRGRLYYEAGLDTFTKIAKLDPEGTHQRLNAFVRKSGFKGIPASISEAEFTIRMAEYFIQKEAHSLDNAS